MEWKLIDCLNINPIYEISPNGDVRRLGIEKSLKGDGKVYLSLVDGRYKHFFRSNLVEIMYPELEMKGTLDDDMKRLVSIIKLLFERKYKKISFTIYPIQDNMIAIKSDKFKTPFSIRKEGDDDYIIRTGKRWNDPMYYNDRPLSNTFMDGDWDMLMYNLRNVLHNKIRENPSINPSKMYATTKNVLTDEECELICQLFIKNGLHIMSTLHACRIINMNVSYELIRKIITKRMFNNISDEYFEYIGDANKNMSAYQFVLTDKGKEFIE